MKKGNTNNYCIYFLSLILSQLFFLKLYSQDNGFIKLRNAREDSRVEIFYKQPICRGISTIDVFIGLKIAGSREEYMGKKLKLTITHFADCKKEITKTTDVLIDLYNLNNWKSGKFYALEQWMYKGGSFISISDKIIDNSIKECKNTLLGNIILSQQDPVQEGNSISLSLSSDARLCDGYNWVWYKDSCDGVPLKQDRTGSLVQTPNRTTVYYVRAEKGNVKTECRSVRVEVKRIEVVKPTVYVPIKINRSKNEQVCPGESVVLSVSGGRESEAKDWAWYKDNPNSKSTPYQKGTRITVKAIERNTIYWVRDLNDERVMYDKIDIQAINVPQLQAITLANNNLPLITKNQEAKITVCEGENISLKITNENVKDFKFNWYTDTNKSNISSGIMLEKTPSDNITYYVRAEGVCNYRTKFIKIDVNVIKKILPPTFSVSKGTGRNRVIKITENSVNQLPVTWNWYYGADCQGKSFASGDLITHNLKDGLKLSVRANRDLCGSSDCFNYNIPESNNKSNQFGFVNIGVSTPSISSLVLTAGYGNFYVRYKMSLKNNPSTYNITTFSPTQYAITDYPLQISDYYEYNGLTSIKRTGITGGFLLGSVNKKKNFQLKIFIGAGFGEYVPMWGVDIIKYSNASNRISRWGTLINERAKGLEAEAGLFIKFKSFNLMGSMNMINDKENGIFTDGSVGVGFIF